MVDVAADLVTPEGLQRVANGNPLCQLAELGGGEQPPQAELPGEDNLQQLLLRGLEIRQQADLLHDRQRQVLRLVHDEDRGATLHAETDQIIVQPIDELLFARFPTLPTLELRPRGNAEVLQDNAQQVLLGQVRVQDDRRNDVVAEAIEHGAQQRRLASASCPDEAHEALALTHTVAQQIACLRVAPRGEEVLRVGGQAEGLLDEPVEV